MVRTRKTTSTLLGADRLRSSAIMPSGSKTKEDSTDIQGSSSHHQCWDEECISLNVSNERTDCEYNAEHDVCITADYEFNNSRNPYQRSQISNINVENNSLRLPSPINPTMSSIGDSARSSKLFNSEFVARNTRRSTQVILQRIKIILRFLVVFVACFINIIQIGKLLLFNTNNSGGTATRMMMTYDHNSDASNRVDSSSTDVNRQLRMVHDGISTSNDGSSGGYTSSFYNYIFDVKKNQRYPQVDIVSIGSVLKPSLQDAQQRTIGTHTYIRNFYRYTEMTDTDHDCFIDLSTQQMDDVIDFCANTTNELSHTSTLFRSRLFFPKKHAGWMCAQKRPVDGLYRTLQKYKPTLDAETGKVVAPAENAIPDYIAIIDDDTYMDVGQVINHLIQYFPFTVPNVVAGCNYNFIDDDKGLAFPYGGYGSYLSKRSIERLLTPIYCPDSTTTTSKRRFLQFSVDPVPRQDRNFVKRACDRMDLNAMGEKLFFTNGMSISDLMFEYAAQQPFADVKNWKAGYCFHSDHTLAYFFNFYHIAVPDDALPTKYKYNHGIMDETARKTYKYTPITNKQEVTNFGRQGECSKQHDDCSADDMICHYIKPEQMDTLFANQQQQQLVQLQQHQQQHQQQEQSTGVFLSITSPDEQSIY